MWLSSNATPNHNNEEEVSSSAAAAAARSKIDDKARILSIDDEISDDEAWDISRRVLEKPYISSLVKDMDEENLDSFLELLCINDKSENCLDVFLRMDDDSSDDDDGIIPSDPSERTYEGQSYDTQKAKNEPSSSSAVKIDPLWEQVKIEAEYALKSEPMAGPQIYQGILSQPTLLVACTNIIANEIATELIPATSLRNLFLQELTFEDERSMALDIMGAALRSPSVDSALGAVLFNKGFHALVCHRVAHRLWNAGRRGLAMFMQSTVSSKYAADIHPAATIGAGVYLNAGAGVVIGETAVVGDDVSILQGVTLGGTGKERGDRHPKVGKGVILHDSATVLGNIKVGDGSVVTAKSIVTKPVPPLARVSGVPAKVVGYVANATKVLSEEGNDQDVFKRLEENLRYNYLQSGTSNASTPDPVLRNTPTFEEDGMGI